MTSHMINDLWRHIHPLLHPLLQLYVIWNKSRDVISVRYHVLKVIIPENPGNELASFLEKKSRRVWERLGASFLEKNPFRSIWINFMTFLKNLIFGKWVSVISGKKIHATFLVWRFKIWFFEWFIELRQQRTSLEGKRHKWFELKFSGSSMKFMEE